MNRRCSSPFPNASSPDPRVAPLVWIQLHAGCARIGAAALHARVDGRANTAAACRKFLDRFSAEVDPCGVLPTEERERRAAHARRAYFLKLAAKSAKARRR